jgi:broad specificity phosphatase PhoE
MLLAGAMGVGMDELANRLTKALNKQALQAAGQQLPNQPLQMTNSADIPGSTAKEQQGHAATENPSASTEFQPADVNSTTRIQPIHSLPIIKPTNLNFSDLPTIKVTELPTLEALKNKHGANGDVRVIVLVRHGESTANKAGTYAGNEIGIHDPKNNTFVDPPANAFIAASDSRGTLPPGGQVTLTAKGQGQALEASTSLKKIKDQYSIKQVYLSPVKRAQDTFNLATNNGNGYEIQTLPGLAERGQGGNVGRPKQGQGAPNPADGSINLDRPFTDRTGYEDWSTFEQRVENDFRNNILGKNTLVVSHQYAMAGILKIIDPQVTTATLGHDIPNGRPLILYLEKTSEGYRFLEGAYVE